MAHSSIENGGLTAAKPRKKSRRTERVKALEAEADKLGISVGALLVKKHNQKQKIIAKVTARIAARDAESADRQASFGMRRRYTY